MIKLNVGKELWESHYMQYEPVVRGVKDLLFNLDGKLGYVNILQVVYIGMCIPPWTERTLGFGERGNIHWMFTPSDKTMNTEVSLEGIYHNINWYMFSLSKMYLHGGSMDD